MAYHLSLDKYRIERNSVGEDIGIVISDEAYGTVDLTNLTVRFLAWGETSQDYIKVNNLASLTTANQGKAKYTTVAGDFDLAPRFYRVQCCIINGAIVKYTESVPFYVEPAGKAV